MSNHTERMRELRTQAATSFAIELIRALLLINGGAVIALLTFIGDVQLNGVDLGWVKWAVGFFAAGVFSGGLTVVFAYFSQSAYADSTDGKSTAGDVLRFLALVFVFGSLILLSFGSYAGIQAFGHEVREQAAAVAALPEEAAELRRVCTE